jgi:hypothetical protein
MPMELTDSLTLLLLETAQSLKGSARRLLQAFSTGRMRPARATCPPPAA